MRLLLLLSRVASSRWFAVVGLLMLAAGGYGGYRVYWFTEHDPRFCKSCHIMQEAWDKWLVSEHNKLDCHKCHHTTKLEGMRQLWLTITQRPTEVGEHAGVPPDVCKECHESEDRRWIQVMVTSGHRVHVDREGLKCLDCHAQSLHSFGAPSEVCKKCHEDESVNSAGMAKLHCTSCHNFLASEQSLVPTRGTCLWCHSDSSAAHVDLHADSPMQFPCGMCHNPHQPDQTLRQRCHTCHQDEAAAASKLGPPHRDCLTCHKPHTWKPDGEETCRTCHGQEIDSLSVHKIASHHSAGVKCVECHRPHEWKPRGVERCRHCHQFIDNEVHPEGWGTRHGRSARKTSAQCEGCHTKAMCDDCHGGIPVPHPTDWPDRHGQLAKHSPRACQRCHEVKKFCGSCHEDY